MKKRIFKIFFNLSVVAVVVVALVFVLKKSGFFPQEDVESVQLVEDVQSVQNVEDVQIVQDIKDVQDEKDVEDVQDVEIVQDDKDVQVVRNVMLEVPFVLQAPFANWDDPLFQDACEEAAILMADGWLEGKTNFTKEQMEAGIRKIADLEKKMLGGFIDASAKDTAKILENFSGQGKVELVEKIKLEDVVGEISAGNLVIVPTDGRKLKNPFYTAPGPVTHMIVIVGYDAEKKEFVTNDSGTRNGEGYRYAENVLFGAIRDYPTGSHYVNPIDESRTGKTMIVVSR